MAHSHKVDGHRLYEAIQAVNSTDNTVKSWLISRPMNKKSFYVHANMEKLHSVLTKLTVKGTRLTKGGLLLLTRSKLSSDAKIYIMQVGYFHDQTTTN